jgi:hypothetical protein
VIPLATTTIAVLRIAGPDQYEEPYGGVQPSQRETVASGVRAVLDRPTGREQVAGGEQSTVDLSLACDPCDIDYRDVIKDERTGRHYRVVWTLDYGEHIEGGLQIVQGEV